jgi:CheY-like chemotaxis protein
VSPQICNLLLVEDSPGDVRLLKEYLEEAGTPKMEVVHLTRLDAALEALSTNRFDMVPLLRNLQGDFHQKCENRMQVFRLNQGTIMRVALTGKG